MTNKLLSVEEAKTDVVGYARMVVETQSNFATMNFFKSIDALISAVLREEYEKKQAGLNRKLTRIIQLTASIDQNNIVWGDDTSCGSIEDLVETAKKILEEKYD